MSKRVKAAMAAAWLAVMTLPGCGSSGVSDREYSLVWQIYSAREFEEGFFEKLSSEQKMRMFREAAGKAGADVDGLAAYMREKYPQAYSQIFE